MSKCTREKLNNIVTLFLSLYCIFNRLFYFDSVILWTIITINDDGQWFKIIIKITAGSGFLQVISFSFFFCFSKLNKAILGFSLNKSERLSGRVFGSIIKRRLFHTYFHSMSVLFHVFCFCEGMLVIKLIEITLSN